MIEQYREWTGARIALDDFEVVGHHEEGELVAVALIRGTEIHAAIHPQWRRRLILRGRMREFLKPLIDRLGFLTTQTVDDKQHDFLRRLGFVPTWTEGRRQHFMLCNEPFERGASDA